MMRLEILHVEQFDEEMDRLRIECFPEEEWGSSARDIHDAVSVHIVCRIDDSLAAYGRMTPATEGYFASKFGALVELPALDRSIDLGRIVVAPARRGMGLCELILLEALLVAARLQYRTVVGSSRPERRFRPLMHELGFVDFGGLVEVKNHAQSCVLQPVVAPLDHGVEPLVTRKAAMMAGLRARGYDVLDRPSTLGGSREENPP